jgi:hypothetical protein
MLACYTGTPPELTVSARGRRDAVFDEAGHHKILQAPGPDGSAKAEVAGLLVAAIPEPT